MKWHSQVQRWIKPTWICQENNDKWHNVSNFARLSLFLKQENSTKTKREQALSAIVAVLTILVLSQVTQSVEDVYQPN